MQRMHDLQTKACGLVDHVDGAYLWCECGMLQIVVASTTIFLAAGRFGLTPSANRLASPGLVLQKNDSGLKTGDPAGFTATDVLYLGTIGGGSECPHRLLNFPLLTAYHAQ